MTKSLKRNQPSPLRRVRGSVRSPVRPYPASPSRGYGCIGGTQMCEIKCSALTTLRVESVSGGSSIEVSFAESTTTHRLRAPPLLLSSTPHLRCRADTVQGCGGAVPIAQLRWVVLTCCCPPDWVHLLAGPPGPWFSVRDSADLLDLLTV